MEKIKLNADSSNWSEVTNVRNYGRTFIAPNGKEFVLIKHKKAHVDEYGNFKSGAQATVTININGSIQTYATPKLKDICGVMKESKNGPINSRTNTTVHYTPVTSESISSEINESHINTYQPMISKKYKDLSIGDYSDDGKIEIIDADRLSYRVFSSSKGATGVRTISKAILNEFVNYVADHPDASADDARNYLSGKTDTDKYEYGYAVTIMKMARMVIAKGVAKNLPIYAEQVIYYGCPGSGKSYKVKDITEKVDKNFVFRTTFHPDTDYASFVGCYKPRTQASGDLKKQLVLDYDGLVEKFKEYLEVKPTNITKACTLFGYDYYESIVKMQEDNVHTIPMLVAEAYKDGSTYDSQVRAGMSVYETSTPVKSSEKSIVYEFCPQVFTNAYVQAWQNLDRPVYLIIEEINRGNCAQIFGDLFQLLDRNDEGYSEYKVTADKDLADYLKGVLGAEHEGVKDGKLCLPPNLIIYATMNTSDQSLFPMDSAFKRRWDWEYVPIEYGADKKSYNFIITIGDKEYRWVGFLKIVNDKIYDATNSEDKQMGNFFIKKSIDAATFVNKVMFYLWNEVCKEEYGTQRNFFRKGKEGKDEFKFTELFGSNRDTILNEFMSSLNVPTLNKEPENTEA